VIVTDLFIAQFVPGISPLRVDSLNAANGVEVVKQLGVLGNDYLLRVTPAAPLDAIDMANRYHQDPLTAFATPDFIARNRAQAWIPNDELFAKQWHLDNPLNDADIDAPEAWDKTTGSSGTIIAVLDPDGFDVANKDLAENLIYAWSFAGCGPTDSYDVASPCGSGVFAGKVKHGTAVAGLAAARADNDEGVAGVCPHCGLMLIEMPLADAAMAQVVKLVTTKGAAVIANSWARDIVNAETAGAYDEAANNGRAVDLGSIVVWSVRDLDEDRCNGPMVDLAQMESAIAVGASNDLDQRAPPSGFGECLDLLAPGSVAKTSGGLATSVPGLTTTDQTGAKGYNNLEPNLIPCAFTEPTTGLNPLAYTRCFSGTSAAAPVVAGVAGLMLSLKPCLKRTQVQEILRNTADKIDAAAAAYDAVTGLSKTHGAGRVNAAAAVAAAAAATCTALTVVPEPEPEPEPDGVGVEIGTRVGLTGLWGGIDRTIINVPGGGPLAEPVLYVAWPLGPSVQVQVQLGGGLWTGGPSPDERLLVAALQPELAVGSFFVGPSVAARVLQIGTGPTQTDFAAGIAVGYRLLPLPFLALRLEGRYRRWFTTPVTDELGLALAVGVVLN
jgi:subtilisin family serine protease